MLQFLERIHFLIEDNLGSTNCIFVCYYFGYSFSPIFIGNCAHSFDMKILIQIHKMTNSAMFLLLHFLFKNPSSPQSIISFHIHPNSIFILPQSSSHPFSSINGHSGLSPFIPLQMDLFPPAEICPCPSTNVGLFSAPKISSF